MTTRSLSTADGTQWSLAEALVGTDEERAASTVAVVATPSGGEQTVRLDLPPGWEDAPDDTLVAAIEQERDG